MSTNQGSYILRSIDPDLWAAVKQRSKFDCLTMRQVLMALLAMYADHRVSVGLEAHSEEVTR